MEITTSTLIEKHPKIFASYEGNPGNCNWYGVPKGWLPIVDLLCSSIQNYIDHSSKWNKELEKFTNPPQVTCIQMKEKFGGLRFYTNGHDEIVEGMIEMAEYMCDNTCQDCGSTSNVGVTTGWISILCQNCVQAHGDRAMQSWKPKEHTKPAITNFTHPLSNDTGTILGEDTTTS